MANSEPRFPVGTFRAECVLLLYSTYSGLQGIQVGKGLIEGSVLKLIDCIPTSAPTIVNSMKISSGNQLLQCRASTVLYFSSIQQYPIEFLFVLVVEQRQVYCQINLIRQLLSIEQYSMQLTIVDMQIAM